MTKQGSVVVNNRRRALHNKLTLGDTPYVKIVNGRHRGKAGKLLRVGNIKNNKYNRGKNQYHDYFNVTLLVDGQKYVTSCRSIRIGKAGGQYD